MRRRFCSKHILLTRKIPASETQRPCKTTAAARSRRHACLEAHGGSRRLIYAERRQMPPSSESGSTCRALCTSSTPAPTCHDGRPDAAARIPLARRSCSRREGYPRSGADNWPRINIRPLGAKTRSEETNCLNRATWRQPLHNRGPRETNDGDRAAPTWGESSPTSHELSTR